MKWNRFAWLLICAAGAGAQPPADRPAASRPNARTNPATTNQDPQPGNPQAPLLGFFASGPSLRLRPILGAPGAVLLGDKIALSEKITWLVVAPGQQYALVERGRDAELATIALAAGNTGDAQPIPGSIANADDRIVFNPSGTAAVIFSASLQRMQMLTGLPAAAPSVREMDLTWLGGTPVTALAVSDDAGAVLVGVSDGTTGAVWLLAGGQSRKLISAGVPSAMRFLPGTQDAIVGDRGFKQILLLTSVVQGFNSRVLATEAQGVNAPTDVEVATDQQRVWIADAGGSGLLIVDLNSGAVTTVNCPFPPTSVTRLAGPSVFLVTGQDGATAGLWAPETANGAVWRLTTTQFK